MTTTSTEMAKSISQKKNKQAKKEEPKVEEEKISIESADSLSDEQVSSDDEDAEIEGLEVPPPGASTTQNLGGHRVNFNIPEKKSATATQKKRGVIYIGRLPQHFQEKEAKKYFRQFGDITRMRIARNKTTGRMKHYGFIEFKEEEPAKVAAETMNNYLIMGHLMKVEVVENPRDDLFPAKLKSNFTEFDWRAKDYAAYHEKKPLAVWEEKQAAFEALKKAKFDELKELGFDYALEA